MMSWRGVRVARQARVLVEDATLSIAPGEIVAIAGPNGAGKSTLLRVMAGEWLPEAGTLELAGRPLAAWTGPERALRLGVLPQQAGLAFDFTVEEVVELGRLPHAELGAGARRHREAVGHALAVTALETLRARPYLALSGGERQRVHLARVIAQLHEALAGLVGRVEPPRGQPQSQSHGQARSQPIQAAMLLDEPTAALDPGHQQRLLDQLWAWSRQGLAVGLVLHDLNLAARYADRLVFLKAGRVMADGPVREVLREEILAAVYGCRFEVIPGGLDAVPTVSLAAAHTLSWRLDDPSA